MLSVTRQIFDILVNINLISKCSLPPHPSLCLSNRQTFPRGPTTVQVNLFVSTLKEIDDASEGQQKKKEGENTKKGKYLYIVSGSFVLRVWLYGRTLTWLLNDKLQHFQICHFLSFCICLIFTKTGLFAFCFFKLMWKVQKSKPLKSFLNFIKEESNKILEYGTLSKGKFFT